MRKQQAVYWAARFRKFPPIASANWIGYSDGTFEVAVEDYHENRTDFDDTCHARTTLHVWQEQYDYRAKQG